MGTICDKLEYLVDTKQAIKDAIVSKGVSISDSDTFRSYPARIARISEKENKPLYNATVKDLIGEVDANGQLNTSTTELDLVFDGVENIGDYVLRSKFHTSTGIKVKSLSMPHLTKINGAYACSTAFGSQKTLTTVNLNSLEEIKCAGTSGNTTASMFVDCTNLTSVNIKNLHTLSGYYACASMFYNCSSADFDLSKIKTISGTNCAQRMFYNAGITNINLSKLTVLTDYNACQGMFENTSKAVSADLSGLTRISGGNTCSSMFSYSGIKSIDLSNLESIEGDYTCSGMFTRSGLTGDIHFHKLSRILGQSSGYTCRGMFSETNISNIYFHSLTTVGSKSNIFNGMLSYTTGVTVHFPAALESVIGSWEDVVNGFGGTNTTVLFDLGKEGSGTTDDGSYTPR